MKKRGRKKYSRDYREYRQRLAKERKRGNIHKYYEPMDEKTFRVARNEGLTPYQIVQRAKIFKTKAQERKAWKEYLFMRKFYSRGEKIYQNVEHFTDSGGREEVEIELGYHYNINGLLHDRYALHFMIAFRIDAGEEQKSVLADYGY